MENKKNLLTGIFLIFFLLLMIKIFNISYPLTITTYQKTSELAVIGEGEVEMIPDLAYIKIGIRTQNQPTVKQAQEKINEVNNKIIDFSKDLGIKKEDIKTINYSIFPNYSYQNNTSQISGYNGDATIEIKTRNINLIPEIISKSAEAGANEIYGITFSISNPEKYQQLARKKAIENAKNQAKKIASELGIKLEKITNIIESYPESNYTNFQSYGKMPILGGGGEKPQIEPGSQKIKYVVTLYFEKK